MVVWGGATRSGAYDIFNTGARYDPKADNWVALSTTNAPSPRLSHTAVWTGKEMVVWGGATRGGVYNIFNTGARYDPNTDNWVALSTANAPSPRLGHTAVWTGQGMLIFGGYFNVTDSTELNSNYFWTPPSLLYLYQLQ